jgi:putative PIN family toxin of toxin-antitoxin system
VRVLLDTNVLVSGFATRGLSADVVRLVMAKHTLITGEVIIEETRRVLQAKFGVPAGTVDDIERLLRRFHVEPAPDQPANIDIRDSDDAWVLASALQAEADVLVTGDADLLSIRDAVGALVIQTPRQFWEATRGR